MKQVSVEIIQKCPNHCVHCSSLSGMDCTMKISTDKVKEVIDGMVKLDAEILSISGGEPFLHEGLLEIADYSKKKKLKTYIYTSGIRLDRSGGADTLDYDLLCSLKETGVDKIIFDLPAIEEEVYDRFMGTRGYLKYALKSIKASKKLGIYTEIHFVPTKLNVSQIDKVIAYAESLGLDMVSFLGLVPHGRAKGQEARLYLDKADNDKLKQKLNKIRFSKIRVGIPLQVNHKEYKCYAGRQKLCIRYDGGVFGCEAFKYMELMDENGRVIKPDSIYDKDIEDIFYHSEYLKKEREFVAWQLKMQGCSENCPVQRALREAV